MARSAVAWSHRRLSLSGFHLNQKVLWIYIVLEAAQSLQCWPLVRASHHCIAFWSTCLIDVRIECEFVVAVGIFHIFLFLKHFCHVQFLSEQCRESLTLFYFNKTENDVWTREQLENVAKNDDRFKVEHVSYICCISCISCSIQLKVGSSLFSLSSTQILHSSHRLVDWRRKSYKKSWKLVNLCSFVVPSSSMTWPWAIIVRLRENRLPHHRQIQERSLSGCSSEESQSFSSFWFD